MRNNDGRFRKTTATGLVPLLLLAGCVARHMPDWSKVQAVSPDTETEVQLYKAQAPQGSRKIKGRFLSATGGAMTLKLEDGQTETFQRGDVRKVLTRRPIGKRWPGWAALGISLGVFSGFRSGDFTSTGKVFYVGIVPAAISTAFFYGSKMGGIYEVPPDQRDWYPQGPNPSATQAKKPEKPR